jgi:hypothetical protein
MKQVQIISPIDKRVAKATVASCLCPQVINYLKEDYAPR